MNTATLPTLRPDARAPAHSRTVAREPATADTDLLLRERVLAQLAHEPGWQAARSNVVVERGRVVLQGQVRSEAARRAARRTIAAVPGVRDVWDARVREREWQSLG